MMKALIRIAALPVLAMVMLFASPAAYADAPSAPQRLAAGPVVQTNTGYDVAMYWWQDMHANEPNLFEIYQADSKTTDLTLFSKIGELTQAEIDSFRTGSGVFAFHVSGLASGEYSYFVTASNQDGTSPESNIIHVSTSAAKTVVKFTTSPPTSATGSGLYVYDADAVATNNGVVKYEPVQVPTGTTLDETTGELRYTYSPNSMPYVSFVIKAYLASDPTVNAIQQWSVRIGNDTTHPRICTVVHGTVVDESNQPVGDGVVHMLQWTSSGYYGPVSTAKITPNGTYTIESHASGKFKLKVDGQFIVPEYWEDATDEQNAYEFHTQCGDTVTANFVVNTRDAVWFTTQPPMTGNPNAEYMYDADAKSNVNGTIKFKAVNIPSGATLDETTGVLKYTYSPNTSGAVSFEIAAYLESDPSIETTQKWTVRFANTNNPTYCMTFYGTVKDATGTPVPEGTITAFWQDGRTGGVIGTPFVGKILHNGEYQIHVYHEGKYILQANGQTFEMEFYEDAIDVKNATEFDVSCGDTLEVNFVVNALAYHTISGTVRDKSSNQGMPAVVTAYATSNAGFTAKTDASGNYALTVPEGQGYYIRAMDLHNEYFTQYYDHATSQTAATQLNVNGDKTGIDFDLEKKPVRPNKIAGLLQDENGNPIVGIVAAHKIEARGNIPYPSMMYKTMTDSSGYFEFTNLEPGEYILQVFHCEPGYAPGYYKDGDFAVVSWLDATRLTVADNSIISGFIFKLNKTSGVRGNNTFVGNIRGKVGGFDQGEVVLQDVMVMLIDESGKISDWSLSDADGNFIMTNATTGTFTLIADVPGYHLYEEEIVLDYSTNQPTVQGIVLIPLSVTSVSGPEPVASDIAVQAYPNPTVNAVNVQFNEAMSNVTLNIYSALGARVASQHVSQVPAGTSITMSTNSLPAGSYYIRIATGRSTAILPLQIVK